MRFKHAPSSGPLGRLPPCGGKACGRAAQCAAPTAYPDARSKCVGAGPRPARGHTLCAPTVERAVLITRAVPLIRLACGQPPSPKGKAFGRLIAAPTVHRKPVGAHSMRPPEFAPVPLVRKRQARERNRTSPNFPPTQAPSGAGRDRTQALLILRAGNVLSTSRDNPRNGVRGKRSYGPRRSKAEP